MFWLNYEKGQVLFTSFRLQLKIYKCKHKNSHTSYSIRELYISVKASLLFHLPSAMRAFCLKGFSLLILKRVLRNKMGFNSFTDQLRLKIHQNRG